MAEAWSEGDKLRKLREAVLSDAGRPMTQQEFAEALGYSRTYVSQNERAARLTGPMRDRLRAVFPAEYREYFGDAVAGDAIVSLDFLDDPDWQTLFAEADEVDLFFAEGSLWRRAAVAGLLDEIGRRSPPVRIRAVLPDILSAATVAELTKRFSLPDEFVKRTVAEAYHDLLSRGAEVYVTDVPPRYALYRFGGRMVVTLYNQRRHETRQVPTIQLARGDVYDWFLADYEAVISQDTRPAPLSRLLPPHEGRTTAHHVLNEVIDGYWDRPPRGKLLKAFSTIADGRITRVNGRSAAVRSSTGKRYVVTYDERVNAITSNDGGSFFRGYLNYPMIAYLMKRDRLPLDEEICSWFGGLNYHVLSRDFQRDYSIIEQYILRRAGQDSTRGVRRVNAYIAELYDAIEDMRPARLPTLNLPEPSWAIEYHQPPGQAAG